MNTCMRVVIALVAMTGVAAAQPKADAKAADPKAAPAKAAEPKPAPAPDAHAHGEMKPPQEVADMAKAAAGTWRCKGQAMDEAMQKMVDMNGTMKIKSDFDGYWMRATFESKMGKQNFRIESFTTFDPASKKWKRVMIESGGGWSNGESAGMKDGKIDWELASHSPMGESMFRDHEDMSDPKVGVKNWGEFSMDKGKNWTKVYEMTCKK